MLGVSLTCLTALAQESLFDQQDVIVYPYTLGWALSGNFAQEFTPSLSSLDFVDLFITSQPLPAPLPAVVFRVSIEDSLGSILSVSQTTIVGPVSPSDPTRFYFSNSVRLVAARIHVLRLLSAPLHSGDPIYWSVYYDPTSSYSGGEAIIGGSPAGVDLWFREGVTNPPLSIVRLGAVQARLVWPTNFTGYSVQCKTNLAATGWTAVTNTASISNGQFSVSVDVDVGQRFFRISKGSDLSE